jgi:hypothetical protein
MLILSIQHLHDLIFCTSFTTSLINLQAVRVRINLVPKVKIQPQYSLHVYHNTISQNKYTIPLA